jgi:hypothetical protein
VSLRRLWILASLLINACASVPNVRADYECTPISCAAVLVEDATEYSIRSLQINGYPISIPTNTMMSSGRIYIPRSVLREEGKCATISVVMENNDKLVTPSACADINEFLYLVIASPLSASSFAAVRIPGQ